MKRISLIVLVCLLAAPSSAIAAQAGAPAQNAPTSAWVSWFKSLRRPTRQDALRAQQFVKSKWRCMVRGQDCSATERNSLRALAAAAAAAVAAAVGIGYKKHQKKKRDEAAWRQRVEDEGQRLGVDRPFRDQEVAIRKMILDLKQGGTTTVRAQEVFEGGRNLNPLGTSKEVAESAIWHGDIGLLRRLIAEGAVNFKEDNVDLSHVRDHQYAASPRNSIDFMRAIVRAPGVDSEYLSQKFGEYNQTLLRMSVDQYPNPAYVELLLDAEVDPTTAGLGGRDVLLDAADAFIYARNAAEYQNVLNTIRLLREYGSNPDAEEYRGKSVREVAREALDAALDKRNHYPRSQDDVERAMDEVEVALAATVGSTIKSAGKR
jgi:hypothetical protein